MPILCKGMGDSHRMTFLCSILEYNSVYGGVPAARQ
jgi:hypothetical protein